MLVEEVIAGGAVEPQYRPTRAEFALSPSLTSRYEVEQDVEFWISNRPWNVRVIASDIF